MLLLDVGNIATQNHCHGLLTATTLWLGPVFGRAALQWITSSWSLPYELDSFDVIWICNQAKTFWGNHTPTWSFKSPNFFRVHPKIEHPLKALKSCSLRTLGFDGARHVRRSTFRWFAGGLGIERIPIGSVSRFQRYHEVFMARPTNLSFQIGYPDHDAVHERMKTQGEHDCKKFF